MTSLAQMMTERWPEVLAFMLVLSRAFGLIIAAPFWGGRTLPVLVRVWLGVVLAIAVYPLVPVASLAGDTALVLLALALGGELLLGLFLGWLAQMLFAGIRLAGQQMELRSGLGLIQLVDPHEGGQSGIFAAFLEVAAGLVFFAINGHHQLIQAFTGSFAVFPLGGEKFAGRLAAGLVGSAAEIFIIALRLSAPVLIGLVLTDIILGVISRAVPHMNVFMVAQPVQFAFCVLLLMLAMPALVWFVIRQAPLMIGIPGAAH